MSICKRSFQALLALAAVLAAGPRAAAQFGEAKPYDPDEIQLFLSATTDRPSMADPYWIGEPVFLTLHLSCFAQEAPSIQLDPSLQGGVEIKVQNPMTLPESIRAPFPAVNPPEPPFDLYAMETRDFMYKLLYDRIEKPLLSVKDPDGTSRLISWPNLIFDHESEYRLYPEMSMVVTPKKNGQITLEKYEGFIKTDPLTILVKSPPKDSPEDLILGRLTVDKRLMEAYQRGQAGPGERGFFELAVADFPQSRFTPHFLYVLANSYDISLPEERDRAIGAFDRIMRDYPNYPAIHELMAAFIRKMDYLVLCDRAHLLTQQLVREDPRIMRGASTSEMLKRYLGLPVLDEPVFGPGNWMLTP